MSLPCDFLVKFNDLTDNLDNNQIAHERLVEYLQGFNLLVSDMIFCINYNL
jgi:hypothetical protein